MAKAAEENSESGFAALGLNARLIETLTSLGYEEPTPIQREAIPPLAEGRDLVGQAATGTGKTAAFALPLLHRLSQMDKSRAQPSVLILVPTRELAMQVAEALHKYSRGQNVSVFPIYGGQPFGQQFRALERGVDVVVATPGRALDHIRRETLKIGSVTTVVLDEADEMLDMGFAEDLEAILNETPDTRQTVLFSATLPARIASIAKRHLTDPVHIKIAQERVPAGSAPKVRQTAYIVQRPYKLAALSRVLDVENPTSALVFCRTRSEVDELTESLAGRGYRAEPLHGGMSQIQRDRVMKKLRAKTADLVIATDVAARGLDIEQLSHVINFNVPNAAEAYVHRIGRVGRAGREGVAITLAEPREHRLLRSIEQATKQKIEITQIPTVADLRAKKLDQTRTAIREVIEQGGLDNFRVVVESLSSEFDIMQIAEAAIKLAHQANNSNESDDDQDIPNVPMREERGRGNYDSGRGSYDSGRGFSKGPGGPGGAGPRGRDNNRNRAGRGITRLYIGLGRDAGIRPQDLVGAIANEAGIAGRDVGGIDIAERFSIVEVPEGAAEQVINALKATKIKGRKFSVRLDNRS
ncbi:MAG TPA: DEAD/DEAH box helicase [Pirellulaceae bacterium]|nr:DEAD/DEAH box helicase [Pirellulaceae bacterium]